MAGCCRLFNGMYSRLSILNTLQFNTSPTIVTFYTRIRYLLAERSIKPKMPKICLVFGASVYNFMFSCESGITINFLLFVHLTKIT